MQCNATRVVAFFCSICNFPPQKRGNVFGWSNVHMLCMAKHATCIDTALSPAKGESI